MAVRKKRRKSGSKWIQKATKKMARKGTKGSYGHHSDAQKRADIKKGGAIAKKARFALNVEKRKTTRKKRRTSRR